ncbi:MAG: hypothetical protein H6P99_1167 [Holophagaceae bacterium]|nr:hypothetical protein [Holophagaceae bacterium]
MKRTLLAGSAFVALACSPARASELGILFDRQMGTTQVVGYIHPLGPSAPGFPTKQEAVKGNGFAIRGAYTVMDLWAAEFSVSATYHSKVTGDFIVDVYPYPPQKFGKYDFEYVALGGQLEWKRLVDVQAGLDVRRERLRSDLAEGLITGTTIQTRPWASAGVGYSFPSPGLTPFVRLEAAYALTHHSLGSAWSEADRRRAMAPRYQVGIYAGVRF